MTRKIELSQEYVDGIRAEYEPNWGPLGWLVYKRTYARWIAEEQRKEEWWETVKRVVEGNINLDPRLDYDIVTKSVLDELQKEAEELFYLIYKLVLTPPGRGLWISGTEFAERTGDALNNCWFVSVKPQKYGDSAIVPNYVQDRPETKLPSMPFSFLFDQSMKGGGVGFNVGKHNIKEMPDKKYNVDLTLVCDRKHANFDEMVEYGIEEPSNEPEGIWNRYLVPDTREGWVEALAWVIDSHFDDELAGKDLMIDVSQIRKSGERIKGFGGIASGPAPLAQLLVDVNELLNKHDVMTSVVATDIMNMIGRTVIAGNVRRTAEIALGDPDDNDFLTMKQDQEKLNSHRWASNNTVLIDNDFSDFEDIAEGAIINGEPGIANMFLAKNYGRMADGFQRGIDKDVDGVNPCFTGDMKLLTKDGYKTFEELSGTTANIVNPDGNVVRGNVWKTGDKDTVRLKFLNRDSIKCTPDHRFMTVEGKTVEAKDLKGERIMPRLIEPALDELYTKLGFIQGDGNLGRLDSDTHLGLEVNLGSKDQDVKEMFGVPELEGREHYTKEYTDKLTELEFDSASLPERELPATVSDWSSCQKKAFLRGLYSANGSVVGKTGRIALKTTSSVMVSQVKKMLEGFGYSPYVTTNKSKVVQFDNGAYRCKESYDLNIANYMDKLKFFNEIGFVHQYKVDKLRSTLMLKAPKVIAVYENGVETVYDFNEPETHWGIVEDVVAHNCAEITAENGEPCNLFEVFPYMLDKEDIEYDLALRLATRYVKRVTFSHYDWELSRNAIQKNRRIGVSISGQQDWMLDRFNGAVDFWETLSNGKYEFEKPVYKKEVVKTLDEMYASVKKADKEYSSELQCEESIKTTTVKPSGTVALLNGMSAGVHWHYSDFYIRRMRFQHDDPLLEVCREAGYHIEPDVYSDRTSVVEFPVKTRTSLHPDFKTAGGKQGVSIEEQFAYQELIQAYWADNSVSCTVTFSKEEEDDIAPLLNYYKSRLKSTSMLPYEDHGYEQAPYEPISMSKYEELMAELEVEPSQLFELHAEEADLELVGLEGCESGVCPIK